MPRRKSGDLEENHDPGRTTCSPLDKAAIREPALNPAAIAAAAPMGSMRSAFDRGDGERLLRFEFTGEFLRPQKTFGPGVGRTIPR
jgi:hypothetical protein